MNEINKSKNTPFCSFLKMSNSSTKRGLAPFTFTFIIFTKSGFLVMFLVF